MPAWHQSHIRTRLNQTDFTSVRRGRRVDGSRDVRGVLVGDVVSRVRLVIAVILYLRRLCVHYAVAESTEKLHPGIFAVVVLVAAFFAGDSRSSVAVCFVDVGSAIRFVNGFCRSCIVQGDSVQMAKEHGHIRMRDLQYITTPCTCSIFLAKT